MPSPSQSGITHRSPSRWSSFPTKWAGKVKVFKTVKAAIEAANQEVGWLIDIYTNYPCGKPSSLLVRTEAIGFMPP